MKTASFVIPIVDDSILEDDEKFSLAIVSSILPNYVIVGDPDQVTVIILNDDGKHIS